MRPEILGPHGGEWWYPSTGAGETFTRRGMVLRSGETRPSRKWRATVKGHRVVGYGPTKEKAIHAAEARAYGKTLL